MSITLALAETVMKSRPNGIHSRRTPPRSGQNED
jgi:hypothetical protein